MICGERYRLREKVAADPRALSELRSHVASCPDCLAFIHSFPADGPPPPEPAVLDEPAPAAPKPGPLPVIGEMRIE